MAVLKKIDVKLNHAGMRKLLRSAEVRGELHRRASAVAAQAGPGFKASSTTGRNRALAMVRAGTAEARRAEATDRVLTSAIDAARS